MKISDIDTSLIAYSSPLTAEEKLDLEKRFRAYQRSERIWSIPILTADVYGPIDAAQYVV